MTMNLVQRLAWPSSAELGQASVKTMPQVKKCLRKNGACNLHVIQALQSSGHQVILAEAFLSFRF